MSGTQYTMVVKTAQSIFNRTMDRSTAAQMAEAVVAEMAANLADFIAAYNETDIFELAELVALDTVKAL